MTKTVALGERGEATRQRILDTAETLFAELGYATARLEDVAQAVGIRRASIVYYFKSKEALYQAVESRIFDALETDIAQRSAGIRQPRDQLAAIADAWLDFMVARPTAARLIMRNCADVYPAGGNPVQFSHRVLNLWQAGVDAASPGGGIQAALMLHIVGGAVLHFVCDANLLGNDLRYDPAQAKERFRGMLHRTLSGLLSGTD